MVQNQKLTCMCVSERDGGREKESDGGEGKKYENYIPGTKDYSEKRIEAEGDGSKDGGEGPP